MRARAGADERGQGGRSLSPQPVEGRESFGGGGSVESLRGPGSSQGPARRLQGEAGGSGRVCRVLVVVPPSPSVTVWYGVSPPNPAPPPPAAGAGGGRCLRLPAGILSPRSSSFSFSLSPPFTPHLPRLSSFTGIGFK